MLLKTILPIAVLLITTSAYSQKKELKTISENELKAHLEFIASDYMQGRDFGTPIPGLEIAASYLKSQCLHMGLAPAAPGFAQIVNMVVVKDDTTKKVLNLRNKNNEVVFQSHDVITFPGSETTDTILGEIVFAGYGWKNVEIGYNDFDSLDIEGKIVVIMTGNPQIKSDSTDNLISEGKQEGEKIRFLMESGVKAIVFISNPLNTDRTLFDLLKEYALDGAMRLEDEIVIQLPSNILFANVETADAILNETGKTLNQTQLEINRTMKPASCNIKEVNTEIILAKTKSQITGENIVAFIEGSHPKLKNEYVILTAHYDHVGISTDGKVNNGADDNASGTATLLEVAEAFMSMSKNPKRSIVFAWVTAEEKGLLGSHYYTKYPLFALENTVANINLDMVGRSAEKEADPITNVEKSLAGPNGIYFITADRNTKLNKIASKVCSNLNLIPNYKLSSDFLNSSDYFHFHNNHIPILGITTGLHEDYHHPSDDFSKIDYVKMKRIASLTFLTALEIANQK